jgi:ribosome modulation factor
MSSFPKHSKEYTEGWDARSSDQSMFTCPYTLESKQGKQWISGWVAADQFLR